MKQVVKLDNITLCADGSANLRFLKQVIKQDGGYLVSEPHRVPVDPDQSIEERLEIDNTALVANDWPSIDPAEIAAASGLLALHRQAAPVNARVRAYSDTKAAAAMSKTLADDEPKEVSA